MSNTCLFFWLSIRDKSNIWNQQQNEQNDWFFVIITSTTVKRWITDFFKSVKTPWTKKSYIQDE